MTQPTVRNISQTHQEREIIKLAPDAIVLIDKMPYVINEYLSDSATIVNINKYVSSISGGVDIESLISSLSIHLSVPNHEKYLFQAPGGNLIISSMSEVRVYIKGYFPAPNGNSLYHRCFLGIATDISHDDNGLTFEIDITCAGALRVYELAQVNADPAALVLNNANPNITGYQTQFSAMHPLRQIANMVVQNVELDTFLAHSVQNIDQGTGTTRDKATDLSTLKNQYASRWTKYLSGYATSFRIFPITRYKSWKDVATTCKALVDDKAREASVENAGAHTQEHDPVSPATFTDEFSLGKICAWLPDLAPKSGISLLDSNLVSRVEKIRQFCDMCQFEGYQDLDGRIIIKPPLYNLDVCNVRGQDGDDVGSTNPHIIYLSEIISEREIENEQNVRLTVAAVKGTLSNNPALLNDGFEQIVPAAVFTNIPLMRKFGLRQEPAKTLPWLDANVQKNVAYAAAEMSRANRSYRTYSITIPLRPELKLGFPIFVPHKDMYAYVRNISWNYNVGSACTMTLSCDMVRRRHLERFKSTVTDGDAKKQAYYFKSVPNLVMKLTKAADASKPQQGQSATNETGQLASFGLVDPAKLMFDKDATNSKVTLPQNGANLLSVLQASTLAPSDSQQSLIQSAVEKVKGQFQVEPDTKDATWRVQFDSEGFYSNRRVVDDEYLVKTLKCQPYTDGKGYELIGPFPWGRHMSLTEAYDQFTKTYDEVTADPDAGKPLNSVSTQSSKVGVFLFTAMGTPTTKTTAGKVELLSQLGTLQEVVSKDITIFEADYSLQENDDVNGIYNQGDASSPAIEGIKANLVNVTVKS